MVSLTELSRFSLFSNLAEEELVPLLPHFKERHYRRGQILFVEGEIGHLVYFVLDGQIKLSKTLPTGEEQIQDWCGPFDSFAEILLLESGSYPTTAEAIRDSKILVLDNKIMPAILELHPRLSIALIRTLNRRLRLAHEFNRILTSRSSTGIVAALLLRLARPASKPGEPIYVDATFTHQDLASMVGTSRECVNRAINHWKRSGTLRANGERLEILNPQELADWP